MSTPDTHQRALSSVPPVVLTTVMQLSIHTIVSEQVNVATGSSSLRLPFTSDPVIDRDVNIFCALR